MNKTLQLKGAFEQRKNTGGGGAPNLPKGKTINSCVTETIVIKK